MLKDLSWPLLNLSVPIRWLIVNVNEGAWPMQHTTTAVQMAPELKVVEVQGGIALYVWPVRIEYLCNDLAFVLNSHDILLDKRL